MSNIETLRPGLLVSLKSSLKGNVNYIPGERMTRIDEDGQEITEMETTRVIADPAEYKRAGEVRSKAGSIIRSVCVNSAFGLLCPEKAQEELEAAIKDARKLIDTFNRSAALTRVSVYVMIGKIASDDVEAVKAINSEVSDLMAQMEQGLKNFDVKTIRDAASKATQVGQMLAPDAAAKVKLAIDAARKSARDIVKAGETAAQEIDLRAIRTITDMRTSFLDLDEAGEVALPQHDHRALDLDPEQARKDTAAFIANASPKIEMEF